MGEDKRAEENQAAREWAEAFDKRWGEPMRCSARRRAEERCFEFAQHDMNLLFRAFSQGHAPALRATAPYTEYSCRVIRGVRSALHGV